MYFKLNPFVCFKIACVRVVGLPDLDHHFHLMCFFKILPDFQLNDSQFMELN